MAKLPTTPVLGGHHGKQKVGYIEHTENWPLGEYWHAYCQYGGKTKLVGGASYPEGAKELVRKAWDKALKTPTNLSEIGF